MDAREQLSEIEGQLKYVISILERKDLKKWERKEYLWLKNQYESEIIELNLHIYMNRNMFKQDKHGNQWNEL